GRQAEALEAYQQARRALVGELGLDPGRRLQELEQAILRHDPSLEPGPSVGLRESAAALVGRKDELARLRGLLGAARAGRGSLALRAGGPGTGKPGLGEEVAVGAAATGATVLWGGCWEAGGAPPFWPWTQLIRAHLAGVDREEIRMRLGRRLPELAAALPP